MNDIITSIIRTIVPMIVGAIVAFFATKGITFDEQFRANMIGVLQLIFSALYYITARALETKVPRLGWLLGSVKQPGYSEPTDDRQ